MNTSKLLMVCFCLLIFPAWATEPNPITYGGGDGTSFQSAVIILGAKDDPAETHAEYIYLANHYPHYKLIRQSLLAEGEKYYDLLEFTDVKGMKCKTYFDITDSFKRFQGGGKI